MKVVLDTNVVLAAMIKPSGLSALLIKALDGERLINFTSEDALDELTLKIGLLAEKGKISPGWEGILAHFLRGSEIVSPSTSFNLCRDPDDNKWLEIAYAAGASYILTWDDDLLSLRNKEKAVKLGNHEVKILKPVEFHREILKSKY
ncbi:MAG: hypothetical protein PWQ79_391 [Thermococcaceae archaeon]|nr:hypothetical protein [Thermococcaceae archaeon]MDK2913476.1 hypothetical protein [Thermococcaceae archaeon]